MSNNPLTHAELPAISGIDWSSVPFMCIWLMPGLDRRPMLNAYQCPHGCSELLPYPDTPHQCESTGDPAIPGSIFTKFKIIKDYFLAHKLTVVVRKSDNVGTITKIQ